MYSVYVSYFFSMSVPTFGNLRVEAYLQLTVAFRSLSRPSSAPDAKAFTLCSFSLELSFKHLLFSRSLELLEFLEHFLFGLLIHCEKVLSFCALNRFPPFGEIVLLPKLERPIILTC